MGLLWSSKRKDSVLGLHPQITLLSIEGGLAKIDDDQFTQCTYHDENLEEKTDTSIRNCKKAKIDEERFSKATNPILKKYVAYFGHQLYEEFKTWEVLKYGKGGGFKQHRDRRLVKSDTLVHIGTQILLPPKSQCDYGEGYLQIYEDHNSSFIKTISPDEKQWTHILLPLGVYHQVTPVYRNTRISYTKIIIVKKKQNIDYKVPFILKPELLFN